MTQASWVWLAWVAWATDGSATFSDDIAATTVASARQTTAVTAPGRPAAGPDVDVDVDLAGRLIVVISCSQLSELWFRVTLHSF